jgi:hypothetical protein
MRHERQRFRDDQPVVRTGGMPLLPLLPVAPWTLVVDFEIVAAALVRRNS